MLILITQRATSDQIKQASQDLNGYVKFVVDVNKNVMTIGGLRHFEGEQLLIANGSRQIDLWGGGVDLESGELDYDSMINIRPGQGNPSREILDINVRAVVKRILKDLLL